jgi:threonine/homoserine/homoserine lactone efflux protein
MEIQLIISFLGASILLSLMPGPDNVFVLTESLSKGHRNGVLISVGLVTGLIVHTTIAATGLSIIIQQSALLFSIIKYLGAAYLFYLAYLSIGETKPEIHISESGSTKTPWFPLVRKGFIMNVLNPKVSLFFIAFLPQFISHNGINITAQMMILGLIFMVQALVIFSSIAILSGRFSAMLNNAKFWVYTKWGKVIILSVLGLTLALSSH